MRELLRHAFGMHEQQQQERRQQLLNHAGGGGGAAIMKDNLWYPSSTSPKTKH